MGRLKAALIREYENDPQKIEFYNPKNTVAVKLRFRGEKMAKVMGSLATKNPKSIKNLSGVLVKRNFNYHIISPNDLPSKIIFYSVFGLELYLNLHNSCFVRQNTQI